MAHTIDIDGSESFPIQPDDKEKIPIQPDNKEKFFIQPVDEEKSSVQEIPHNGKKIDQMIVSQDMSYHYVVTYSREDDSICGWTGLEKDEQQFEKDGQQFEKNEKLKFDTYIKLNEPNYIVKFVLYKKILLYRYVYFDSQNFKYGKYHYLKICLNKKISISN
jgi:hypothetical protein